MFDVLTILFVAVLIAIVIGLFRPALLIRSGGNPSRGAVLKIFGSAAAVLFVLMLIIVPETSSEEADAVEQSAAETVPDIVEQATETSAPIAAPPAMAEQGFGPGTHLVGTDIQPGRYRSDGPTTYIARLSGLGGQVSDIIANEASIRGPVVVDIAASDVAFRSQGRGRWLRIDDSYQPIASSTFGDGWWIVGRDIEPGTYRTQEDVAYYARLRGFGHSIDDIIANEARSIGGAVVEIRSTDAGFVSKGGATWTKIR